jgi:hypothetical protein
MGSGAMLSPWTGFGVFCAWTAALVIAAGWHLQTHDI